MDDAEFEENEVYAIGIVASTGESKVVFSCIKLLIYVNNMAQHNNYVVQFLFLAA